MCASTVSVCLCVCVRVCECACVGYIVGIHVGGLIIGLEHRMYIDVYMYTLYT